MKHWLWALLVVVLGALVAPAVAKADVVTDWNQTMVTGLEAAHVGPQPSSRIGASLRRRSSMPSTGSSDATRRSKSPRTPHVARPVPPPPRARRTPRSWP